ncbi:MULTISPECIES: hypothetical protein [Halanaerobium]|jgi:hypothetical protein|uniref:YokE-like PH domain-containing protein n=1 Tax=Halanaerobium congolense TaxID=54121 RepID=A0A4R8GMX0_9FIRM|nr:MULTISPECIES: hypothetical protein [Halanaerobium]PUU89075.1 MAG: hypothetical protein CI949_2858 [Halanaerobium sp.]TDX42897.1 hypothetical protein C7954_1198 [Halanaerobium congolense]SDK72674.1 hypothetical protein SAMN04515655_11316 [Halanaerobium congolense]SDL85736.1 hypothetical protein SAMN04488599_101163 [Halanaerobium congolense]
MQSLEQKINSILEAKNDVHHIFKEVISKKSIFTEKEDIIDLIFIKREHLNERDIESSVYKSAKLLVATTHGIIFLEEGFKEITDNYLGYRIKHLYYDKISSIELDICLLEGQFKIITDSSEDPVVKVKFNSSNYYEPFENFVDQIRKQRFNFKNYENSLTNQNK